MAEIIVSFKPKVGGSDQGCIMGERVGELVRCGDCEHWDDHMQECANIESICFRKGLCEEKWFCGDGVRRK